jgi:hypothetical protein
MHTFFTFISISHKVVKIFIVGTLDWSVALGVGVAKQYF